MYLTIVRRGGRELVLIEILLCAMSQADPEMQMYVDMMYYETAPGKTRQGSRGS